MVQLLGYRNMASEYQYYSNWFRIIRPVTLLDRFHHAGDCRDTFGIPSHGFQFIPFRHSSCNQCAHTGSCEHAE